MSYYDTSEVIAYNILSYIISLDRHDLLYSTAMDMHIQTRVKHHACF